MLNNKYKNYFKYNLSKGFSMIELLLIVTVLVTFSLIAVRGLDGFRIKQIHNDAESNLLSILNEGRARASSGDYARNYTVQINSTSKTATLTRVTTSGADTPYTSSINLDTKISLTTSLLNTSTETITFQRFTGATTNTGTVAITTSGFGRTKTSTIRIYASGLAGLE